MVWIKGKSEAVLSVTDIGHLSVARVEQVDRDDLESLGRVFSIKPFQNRFFFGTRRAVDFPKV